MKKIAIAISLIILSACGSKPTLHTSTEKTYVVKPQKLADSLHFTGNIHPLQENTLASPANAVIETLYFHYGQTIKKGEVILVLNSMEWQKQYNDTLTEYLKAKDSYTVAKAKFVGTKDLWEAGLIAKNNYVSEASSLAATRMGLLQASQKLKEMGEKMDDPNAKNLSLLNLTQFEKINQIFETKRNLIFLRAKTEGVLLEAPKNGEKNKNMLSVGSQIKAGEVLGLIGDLSGLSIQIDIPEVDIHKIHVGMSAQIEGVAFGGQSLQGKLTAINAQASNGQGGGLPFFQALVEVKTLTPEQAQWIKVGMSAAITLKADEKKALMIPIAALQQEKGQAIVKIKKSDGSIASQKIVTGLALSDQVLVTSGLKEGDILLYG